jgi:hypothetical protein
LPHYPTHRMRAISRFPLPDSHVSLSAVLEPGPTAQPAPPPQPTPTTKQLTPKPRDAAAEPTLTDTPRHHNPPRLRTGPLTWLPDCCATQTGASLRPGAQPLKPSPASITNHIANRTRHATFTPRKHTTGDAASAHYLRTKTRSPPQALSAPSSSLRPNEAFDLKGAQSTRTKPGHWPCRNLVTDAPLFKMRFTLPTISLQGAFRSTN